MVVLRKGSTGDLVRQLQTDLTRAGYAVGKIDGVFGAITERALREFQAMQKLVVDGVAGRKTIDALERYIAEAFPEANNPDLINTFDKATSLPAYLPTSALDVRMDEAIRMQQLCNGQGCRYGGWKNPYLFDGEAFDTQRKFIIPRVGRILPESGLQEPIHGGTCSPWAGLILGWYLCANEDYNFRIGRSAYQIANFDHNKVYKNSTIPGYADYCEVEGVRRLEKLPLSTLYKHWDWLNRVNFVEMDHHCILVLKVGGPDGLRLHDPELPATALPSGLYRWAADGFYPRKDTDGDGVPEKFYSGTRQTFRRIEKIERVGQGWDVYRVADVDPDTCSPTVGPWAGNEPWDLVLE